MASDDGIDEYTVALRRAAETALRMGSVMAVLLTGENEYDICERDAVVGSETDCGVIAYVGVLGAMIPDTKVTP